MDTHSQPYSTVPSCTHAFVSLAFVRCCEPARDRVPPLTLCEASLQVDRRLVDRANPGDRVTVTGIMSILSQQGGRSEDKKVANLTGRLPMPAQLRE